VNGVTINKPFVEKPVDADDHNIAIYYPSSAGGGCKKLFRKVGDRSSEFYPEINEIRRDGSYIYEEFIETQGTDVKMYTVGPDYGHAEARKSPAVDGKVERNPEGKEVRFPVILTLREKEIARRIVLKFKQQVCGFDILRIQEGDSLVSYVCDVNGWSFVKNSRKYYDDCAQILTEHMLALLKPKSLISFSALAPLLTTVDDTKSRKKINRHHRGASIADRVKSMLMGASNSSQNDTDDDEENDKVTDLQTSDAGSTGNTFAIGNVHEEPVAFTPIRDLPDQLSTEPVPNSSIVPSASSSLADPDDGSLGTKEDGPTSHEEELRCVITIIRHGDRTPKQKLKYVTDQERVLGYFHDHKKKVKKDLKVKAKKNMIEFLTMVKALIGDLEAEGPMKNFELLARAKHIRDILERWQFSGLNRKLQMKPQEWVDVETPDGMKTKCSKLHLIVKWGGDLTKLGEKQATQLGNRLRNELYPSNKGGGILRLHSTFRHDLKIKTSDEGRVMKTAAAFAKGMLELEGDLPPILVSLVHKEKDSQHMLDPSGHKDVKADLDKCKEKINANMQRDIDYDKMTKEERESLVGPEILLSLHRALKEVGNPRKTLIAIHSTIGQLVDQLDDMLGELLSGEEEVNEGGAGLKGKEGQEGALSGIKLYKGETLLELTERWKLLHNKLYDEESETFDLSRVPDVHDNVRFDMLHNPHLGLTETLQKLYDLAKSMADCVVPQEYGITIQEKRDIGAKMCHTLLEKIK
jgi:inositol hexakisphosphate/diphosphoinositol-pentakisphosphate kinase